MPTSLRNKRSRVAFQPIPAPKIQMEALHVYLPGRKPVVRGVIVVPYPTPPNPQPPEQVLAFPPLLQCLVDKCYVEEHKPLVKTCPVVWYYRCATSAIR